ncbi:MAG: hypothetical protein R3A44_00370 [Caldilineaceae bacterium]
MHTYDYDSAYSPSAPVVDITITIPTSTATVTVSALIDSGADATVLPLDLLTRISVPALTRGCCVQSLAHA